jgi:NADH-quinone oxidoreductase subunit N
MTLASLNLASALPEMFLLCAACAVLLLDLFLDEPRRHWAWLLTLLSLGVCTVLTLATAQPHPARAFNGMFVQDPMGDVLKVFVYIAVAATLVYYRVYARSRQLYRGEFLVLALFATLGMMVMISASHFLTLYLGLELMSLSLYSMTALQRDSAQSTEAAMKYFVLGALSSGMLLYGMSMVYGATGSLAIDQIALKAAGPNALTGVLVFGIVFIVAGIGFKLGAVPFHMWVPDVYQGAPTPVALLIGSAPKLAALAFIFRVLIEALGAPALLAQWQDMLALLAVLSMALGNVTAIAQTNIKRMLAYSTIAQMGFLLLGILAGTPAGYAASMFYALTYVLMTLAAFGMLMLLSREGFEAELLEDFRGLNQRSRWYAFLMLLVMFSLAGIPVLLGFWAKLAVFQAAFAAGYTGLVIAAVLFSLIGAFYYLRVVRLMYFDAPTDTSPIVDTGDQRALMTVNGLALLVLGIAPGWLLTLCQQAITASLR